MSRQNLEFLTRNLNPESVNFGSKNKSMFNIEMPFVKILNKEKELRNVFIQICILAFFNLFLWPRRRRRRLFCLVLQSGSKRINFDCFEIHLKT